MRYIQDDQHTLLENVSGAAALGQQFIKGNSIAEIADSIETAKERRKVKELENDTNVMNAVTQISVR